MDKEIKDALELKFKETNERLDTAVENGATKDEITKLEGTLIKQGEALQDFIESQKVVSEKTFDDAFEDFLNENKENLDAILKAKTGEIEFIYDAPVSKVVGDITAAGGGDVAAAPVNHNTSLSRVRLRDDNPLINMCNVIRTSKPSFPYTEMSPKDGDYTFVAEGGSKPQIDFQWAVRYAEPYKIAAHEILTEEAVRDLPRMMDTAKGYLKDRHDLFKANGIYFGDGTGENCTGATVIGRAFIAGDMADKFALNGSTLMDQINAVITDIYTTHNYTDEVPYMPNVVLLNPVDFFLELQAAKDANNWALYGGVQLFSGYKIGNVTILPWEKIPAGSMFVGDMSKYNISNWVRYSVRLGWINDQFITNKFTIVGESRFHAFVKNFDEQAFVYDTIANVKAGIEAAS